MIDFPGCHWIGTTFHFSSASWDLWALQGVCTLPQTHIRAGLKLKFWGRDCIPHSAWAETANLLCHPPWLVFFSSLPSEGEAPQES